MTRAWLVFGSRVGGDGDEKKVLELSNKIQGGSGKGVVGFGLGVGGYVICDGKKKDFSIWSFNMKQVFVALTNRGKWKPMVL